MDKREADLLAAAKGALRFVRPVGAGYVVLDNLQRAIDVYEPRKTALIAGTYRQAEQFLGALEDRDLDRYVVATTSSHLRGFRLNNIMTIGTWWDRKDLLEVLEAARAGLL